MNSWHLFSALLFLTLCQEFASTLLQMSAIKRCLLFPPVVRPSEVVQTREHGHRVEILCGNTDRMLFKESRKCLDHFACYLGIVSQCQERSHCRRSPLDCLLPVSFGDAEQSLLRLIRRMPPLFCQDTGATLA